MISMVLMMAACSGQAPKTETQKKDSIVTARDVAEQKLAEVQKVRDSLETVLQTITAQEAEKAAYVIEHATKLSNDAPEVLELNSIRMQLDSVKKQFGVADGQVKYLKKKLESAE